MGKTTLITLALIVILFNCENAKGAKILVPYPSFSKSHWIIASELLKGLAERGHEVTIISAYPLPEKIPNYRDIAVEIPKEFKDMLEEKLKQVDGEMQFLKFAEFLSSMLDFSNSTIAHPEVQKMMKEEKFDLVIVSMFGSTFTAGLAAHFDCPLAILTQIQAPQFVGDLVGNPMAMATVPHMFSNFNPEMTFVERLKNALFYFAENIITKIYFYYEKKYYDSVFPSPKYPSFDDVLKNVSLVLVNAHFSQGHPVPRLPNIVEIGGVQVKEKLNPLPKDIQEFLDSAVTGAVYFSLGSNMKSSLLPRELLYQLMNVFGMLDMKVLFKWELDEKFPFMPQNVLPVKWLPQNEVLAHKNVKLFIGHGGMGGVTEAKFHGVPLIGIPMFGDQSANMENAVNEGWAIKIEYKELNETILLKSIMEITKNPSYLNNVKQLSLLIRDRPMSPLDTANYWIEYVIRHKGAKHMRSPAVHMNFFQKNSLDVFAFLLGVLFVVLKVVCCCCKCGCKAVKWVFRKKDSPSPPGKKKQKKN